MMVMVMVNDFMIEERVKAEQKGRRAEGTAPPARKGVVR